MKEKFESILNEHGIYGENVKDILCAVSDMLDFVADKIKEEEPYASDSIERVEKSAFEVFSLIYKL